LSFRVERRDPASIGITIDALESWLAQTGPVAIVDLETTGLPESRSAEILEIAVVLLDPEASTVGVAQSLVRPTRPIPTPITRLTDLVDADVSDAPRLEQIREDVCRVLAGRTLVAHQVEFERRFLTRDIDPELANARFLDTQEILSFTHPDAPDLRLETFCRLLLGREEQHRAEGDALDAARVLSAIAEGAREGIARYREARRILARHLGGSVWLGLLAASPKRKASGIDFVELAERAQSLGPQGAEGRPTRDRFLAIGETKEKPVPFEMESIVAALADAERGLRHFPGYRVREEQLELAREFVHVLEDGGIAKLEGGTGVGKSLAYLAAAIPFAMQRAGEGAKQPILLSTRTKILQDQLLRKDIAAAARFLGYPDLRALSIKGRANYVCERRLAAALGAALDPVTTDEMRTDFAMLEACARLRPNGEVGTVPAALLRRHPGLRELLRASVAVRADQCSREQCARERRCPFGRHRRALAEAHLVVANHDLLLRWPPDYPSFSHVIMDEGHELGGVAEEVYALRVRPEDLGECLDELFGAPIRRGQRRYAHPGLVAQPDSRADEATIGRNRRDLILELIGLGRTMAQRADAFGGAELPALAAERMPVAAELALRAATRLESLAAAATCGGPSRRVVSAEDPDGREVAAQRDLDAKEDAERQIAARTEALHAAAHALRIAFGSENEEYVGAFERLETPHDRWSLVLRPVAPGDSFREEFLHRLDGLAVVSATLFVAGDAYAALGELGLGDGELAESWSRSVGSPFPYERAMRVVAIEGRAELVEETAQTLAILARTLHGRTLGLFTSLARMREAADRLTELLAGEGIEVLLPRRAGDDPGALVDRFQRAKGGAVLLGARRFWQGIDVRGEGLQAVVIEKLPFDVPTELRRRRDERLRAAGENPFSRSSLGRMLLHLKQMVGRLIRSETDRGLVVIVDARREKGYFQRLEEALPAGTKIEIAPREDLPRIAGELGLGATCGKFPSK